MTNKKRTLDSDQIQILNEIFMENSEILSKYIELLETSADSTIEQARFKQFVRIARRMLDNNKRMANLIKNQNDKSR